MSPRFGALPGTSRHAARPNGRPAATLLADRASNACPPGILPDFHDLARSFERTVP
jgi:hypothetical protein